MTNLFSLKKLIDHKSRIIHKIQNHNFLFEISAQIIRERLESFTRKFDNIYDYNNGETYLLSDYLEQFSKNYQMASIDQSLNQKANQHIKNETFNWPHNNLDLFIANLNLHWINNLPEFLIQIFHSLNKNGVFIGSSFGRNTLKELRKSIYDTQEELGLPFSNHISPFINSENGAALLHRAGFTFKVADFEEITVSYPNLRTLLHDLRGMGETNNMTLSFNPFNKQFLYQLEHNYQKHFSDNENNLTATYELIILTAAKV